MTTGAEPTQPQAAQPPQVAPQAQPQPVTPPSGAEQPPGPFPPRVNFAQQATAPQPTAPQTAPHPTAPGTFTTPPPYGQPIAGQPPVYAQPSAGQPPVPAQRPAYAPPQQPYAPAPVQPVQQPPTQQYQQPPFPQPSPTQTMPPHGMPTQPTLTQGLPTQPILTHAASVPPASAPPFGHTPYAAQQPSPGRRISWPGIVALALVALLLAVTGFQAYQINDLGNDLDAARADLAREDADSDKRVGAIEERLATQFDAEKIAAKTLPSVFRVRTGSSIGTAFAVGAPASDGGTNLLTNFHVIEDVWDSGTKKVKIEHADQLYDATVVAGDKKADIAQLHTTAKIDGLKVASGEAKSGQQILVVGAPLGLKDTVTSGVVSAFRAQSSQHGPYIQFDAPINPGNSGGPVINAAYEVIGIASAKYTDAEGLGLAIPIKIACDEFTVC